MEVTPTVSLPTALRSPATGLNFHRSKASERRESLSQLSVTIADEWLKLRDQLVNFHLLPGGGRGQRSAGSDGHVDDGIYKDTIYMYCI
jgi:hypothetical protein